MKYQLFLNIPNYYILYLEFMKFFGIVFLITTTLIMIFKKETDNSSPVSPTKSIEDTLSLKQTYKIVWRILCLPSVQLLGLILITCRVNKRATYLIYN